MFGDRNWVKYAPIRRELKKLCKAHGARNLIIIEGECEGADEISRECAEEMGIHVARVHPLWDIYGRPAGPMRNGVMKALAPDEGIGFHAEIERSRGTANMKGQLDRAGIPCRIVKR